MRKIVLAAIFGLSASTSLAQTTPAPQPNVMQERASPAAPETPAAPAAAAPTDPAAPQASAEGPANLCQELLAFMKAPPPETAAPAAAAKPAAAPAQQAAPGQQAAAAPAQPADQATAPDDKQAAAGQDKPASGEAVPPKSPNETGSAQEVSGQSGPAHESPEQNSATAAQGNVQGAQNTSSLSAPVPTKPSSVSKETHLSMAAAEELASANDMTACRDASRKLRLAGVAMPEPLLALTALDLQYQQTSGPQDQAPDAETPRASE